MENYHLVYINIYGPNYKRERIYEFIFNDSLEAYGDGWDAAPANGNPEIPYPQYIKKVGVFCSDKINLITSLKSTIFGMGDILDGIIALAWSDDENSSNRLVFHYGETLESISDKLYAHDIVLEFKQSIDFFP